MKWLNKNLIISIPLALVLSAWLIYVIFAFNFSKNFGASGDAFGSLNTLFTGLAFIGLIWTIQQQRLQIEAQSKELKNNTEQLSLQREELALTREEMKLNRQEMTYSNRELAGQKQAIQYQNFQSHLFGLLNLYRMSINGITGKIGERNLTGISALNQYARRQVSTLTGEDPIKLPNFIQDATSAKEASEIYSLATDKDRIQIEFIAPKLAQMLLFAEEFIRTNEQDIDNLFPHKFYDAILIGLSRSEKNLLEAYIYDIDSDLKKILEYYSDF